MTTYLQRDGDGNPIVTPFGKPAPLHTLTPAAESARQSVRDHAERQAQRLTRADVEAAYVHPAPEVEAAELDLFEPWSSYSYLRASGAKSLVALAQRNGHRVKATYNRGTTPPRWTVNSPDNKTNPGPPVEASQYHGELVDVETVYVVADITESYDWGIETIRHRIRGVWHNGKLDRIEVDGVETTLKAAREVLS